jgi:2-keto-4-pentenoate hydratase/2-oxohepta-3-ene-1,7-dioic acid hydratase in catechol pathway
VSDLAKTKQARIISGNIFGKHEVTDQVADVRLLLAPLALEDVRTVRCLGLNYEKHAIEVRRPFQTSCCRRLTHKTTVQPTTAQVSRLIRKSLSRPPLATGKLTLVQYKPATALTGPTDPIPVHRLAQQELGMDYECEMVVVIGKPCSDVSESKALDYVLGYSVGNDVSHRDWQLQRGGGQWSLGKGMDGCT